MRIRGLLATFLTVVALLAPAAVAQAAPSNPLTVSLSTPSVPTVYPVADGFVDTVTLSGSVAAATPGRIRATLSVVVGTRVLKNWTLNSTGAFSFVWNGKSANGGVVAGSATVLLRAVQDDGTIAVTSTPISISAKKLTKLTYSRVAYLMNDLSFECYDNSGIDWMDPNYGRWLLKVCPLGFATPVSYSSKSSSGGLFVTHLLTMPSAVRNSLGPVTAKVAARFAQSGAGSNKMWVCADLDDPCATSAVKTWSGSATIAASTALIDTPSTSGMTDLRWWIRLAWGHSLTVKSYTVTFTYWGLR